MGMKKFSALLYQVLQDNNLSQGALGDIIGTSQSFISSLLSGTRHASPKTINLICERLKLSEIAKCRLSLAAARDRGYYIVEREAENG
jgi:transcriptional regulator with XRE-family HTH domain